MREQIDGPVQVDVAPKGELEHGLVVIAGLVEGLGAPEEDAICLAQPERLGHQLPGDVLWDFHGN